MIILGIRRGEKNLLRKTSDFAVRIPLVAPKKQYLPERRQREVPEKFVYLAHGRYRILGKELEDSHPEFWRKHVNEFRLCHRMLLP